MDHRASPHEAAPSRARPRAGGARAIALVGPFQSGKSTLFEAIMAHTGAIARPGSVEAGTSLADASPEARAHHMSLDLTVATTRYLGDSYGFIDCPGSVEFAQEARGALEAADLAVVVCEADPRKLPQLQLILRDLEARGLPHLLFLNKIDKAEGDLHAALGLLQRASTVPLLLRQIPIWRDGIAVGFVDLALERAYVYREHAASQVVPLEGDLLPLERKARFSLLEKLADHDDALLEQLLDDIEPPRDLVFDDLAEELRQGAACPVLIGSAAHGHGVGRLLKALRHEAPDVAATRARLGVPADAPLACVVKTLHTTHGGKVSLARVLAGEIAEGAPLIGGQGVADRVAGVLEPGCGGLEKRRVAVAGDLVALTRLEHAATGDFIAPRPTPRPAAPPPAPVLALCLAAHERKDDVKLGLALARLAEEDPSLVVEHDAERGEIRLAGQGEMHLRVAVERLAARFGVTVATRPPRVGYCETIRRPVTRRGRHKKQSGGHGQFGDVVLEISPLPRGAGVRFVDASTGGVVPRQYVGAVEEGAREALRQGALGFPVVDVEVKLLDGSHHSVDSSDQAFRAAARLAIAEALPEAAPVLLEPVHEVVVSVPGEAAARVNALIAARRGQMLGFEPRPGWDGWETLRALLPEAEIGDLIVELRSASAGVGSFVRRFDHLQELAGREAESVVAAARAA
ncbi:elongation factor G [Ancylobacter lacus]|uniref:elongation factor G n=1 Tax=Ancylobacter lacus TaxID=2579970 RepID=UPI001BCF4470|nr:elongation factor G [Ancylobacter lacus]MBS7538073.1 elongation factor G [Ancylobacter lacus]